MTEAGILFVDDDLGVLSSMRRMMHPLRLRWSQYFAPGGQEALEILSREKIDVVVSDMRMPVMNGAQLLAKVKIRHPNVARIILSGHSERRMAVQAINVAHQYLNKPCTLEELSRVLEKTISLRRLLGRRELCEMANGVMRMPSLPTHYVAITKELSSEEPSVEKVASIIEADPAMTITVLRLVNSGFFGLPSRIHTVLEATGMLGLELLRNLTLASGLFSKYEGGTSFSIERFSRRAIAVGSLARRLAAESAAPKAIVEECFISGMMCDLGMLILSTNMSDTYSRILGDHLQSGHSLDKLESMAIGASHAEIGAYLMGLWGFSDGITEAVAYHHKPSASLPPLGMSTLAFVHAADCLLDADRACVRAPEPDEDYLRACGLAGRVSQWRQMIQSDISQQS